jgi:glycosyltransferase involved in cell wall biosynthesis
MRILHTIDAVSWRYGGTTATVLPLCDALARKPGVTVEIAATDADGPGRRLAEPPACSVPVRLFRNDLAEFWKFSREMYTWLNRHVRDYDLVHAHGVWNFTTTVACRAARRQHIPYILFPQGMLSNYTWSRSRRSALQKRVYWRLIERANARGATRLHLTSEGEGREMEPLRLGVPASVIPLGLEPAAWETPIDRDWLRARLGGRDRGRPIVLFLSRLHSKKGVVDFLLPAFRAVTRDGFLVIAGGADAHAPGYEAEVHAAVAALGLTDRVHLLGPVSPAERWPAFDGADVFVLPSKQENFGLVVTEAMARGVPVVSSEHAYSCEHLGRAGGAGLVTPLKVEAITHAIDRLLADPAERSRMGAAGRAYAPRLSWDNIADEVVEMYRTCLAGAVT